MTTTTNNSIRPRMMRTSNTPLYWGVAILAAVIIALALMMRPARVAAPITTAEALDTTPPTNVMQQQQTDPATGRAYTTDPTTGAIIQNDNNPTYDASQVPNGTNAPRDVNGMATDPRLEQMHNGANAPNGGINPNANPASQPPNTSPSGY